jgi:hypothetical protein
MTGLDRSDHDSAGIGKMGAIFTPNARCAALWLSAAGLVGAGASLLANGTEPAPPARARGPRCAARYPISDSRPSLRRDRAPPDSARPVVRGTFGGTVHPTSCAEVLVGVCQGVRGPIVGRPAESPPGGSRPVAHGRARNALTGARVLPHDWGTIEVNLQRHVFSRRPPSRPAVRRGGGPRPPVRSRRFPVRRGDGR